MKQYADFNKSISDHWSTPLELYQYFMNRGFLDPCPLYSKVDGLKIDYFNKKLFINPPFSHLNEWCDYALKQVENGCYVVLLMPARTDTKYFHKLLAYQPLIIFFKGRLKFGGSKDYAPFPTILVSLTKYSVSTYTSCTLDEFIYQENL